MQCGFVQSSGCTECGWGGEVGVDWGGLGMWNVRVGMIGCRPVEMWWWRGWDVRVEGGRLGMNVWRMIWRCLVYILNGQCSGICGEASYWEERLTLAERGRNGRFKNEWWWWWTSQVTDADLAPHTYSVHVFFTYILQKREDRLMNISSWYLFLLQTTSCGPLLFYATCPEEIYLPQDAVLKSFCVLFVAEFVAIFSAALARASSYQFPGNSWTHRAASVSNVTRKRWHLSPETTVTCRVPIVNGRRCNVADELLRHFIFSLNIVYLPTIRN